MLANPNDITSFVKKTSSKEENEIHRETVKTYLSFFGENEKITEDKEKEMMRKQNYAQVTNSYYDVATDFYEYGWGQSFHFARTFRGDTFEQSIARHEHFLALKLGLKPGMNVADFGCGVAGPLIEIARFSGSNIMGVNNNAYQVEKCRVNISNANLDSTCSVIKGDFTKLPVQEATFDAVYAIEATVHAPTPYDAYAEVFRTLKPGALFACYEWCTTDAYDASDPRQRKIISDIEEGDGISHMVSTMEVLQNAQQAGFEILESCDLASDEEVPWWETLAQPSGIKGFRRSVLGRIVTGAMVRLLEYGRIAPEGATEVSNILSKAGDALVEGGRENLFTPMFFFLARKPSE